ncbi:type II toxin-antitoxin system RelE/ParE family toxin [Chachezhania sediminis]|uniref:type II toxin-antitoxin system RelE/ParE family toxin n=1 Tax=Chachezhania sediminis TaxID=2599291 RepID=UPI00131E6C5F|nr:type II toxin-antitoxin system RelE/ParE family toxin [Chachezhania sediminis]
MKPWRLTPRAQDSLVDIALWTIQTFGPAQAEAYEAEVLDRCQAVAAGHALLRDCSVFVGEAGALSYARAGEHFLIVHEMADEIVIVDILHSRSDLPRRIAALHAMRQA